MNCVQVVCACHEARAKLGEDAYTWRIRDDGTTLCVMDGCGGLGSRRYPQLDMHTGAYTASRIAADCVWRWSGMSLPVTELPLMLESAMEVVVRQADLADNGRIRGTMIRTLPTTLCLGQTVTENGSTQCDFVWAGDSRGYVLSPFGLVQCTRDDLTLPLDPMENLYRDAPLSLIVSADAPVVLHRRRIALDGFALPMVATDGCFSALPSPMHFELLLLETLNQSRSAAHWESLLTEQLHEFAMDDATLLTLGPTDDRWDSLIDAIQPRLEQMRALLDRTGADRDALGEAWLIYRNEYL